MSPSLPAALVSRGQPPTGPATGPRRHHDVRRPVARAGHRRPGRQRFRAWPVASTWAVLATLLALVGSPGVAAAADAADTPDVAPLDDADRPADDAGERGRLTWGIVPSGPDGPTGRPHFDLRVEPGEVATDHVGVVNYTFDELTVAIYAHDAFTTDAGGFDILPATGTSTGAGTWIEVAAPQVTIPPRSRVDVPMRLHVPANATPGDHAAGVVAALTGTTVDADGNRLAVDRRVGARIYLRVAGELDPQLTVELTEARYRHRANPLGRGTVEFTYQVTNTGNVRLASRPTVATHWLFGWLSQDTDGQQLPELLPGESWSATTELSGVAPLVWLRGDIQLQPIPPDTAGLDQPVPATSATAWVWAIPWSLAVLLAAATAGWAGYRRRRRRQHADTSPHAAADAAPAAAGEPS